MEYSNNVTSCCSLESSTSAPSNPGQPGAYQATALARAAKVTLQHVVEVTSVASCCAYAGYMPGNWEAESKSPVGVYLGAQAPH